MSQLNTIFNKCMSELKVDSDCTSSFTFNFNVAIAKFTKDNKNLYDAQSVYQEIISNEGQIPSKLYNHRDANQREIYDWLEMEFKYY